MAGRPPLPIGTWGAVRVEQVTGGWRARARFRDIDGITRDVERRGKTKSAARNALTEHLKDRVAPAAADLTAESTVEMTAHLWIAARERDDLAPATMRRYREVIADHILPGIGAVRLREATVPRLEVFLASIIDRVGEATAKLVRTVLVGLFTLAVRYGALAQNPMRDVSGVTVTKKAPVALTLEQVKVLRAALLAWQTPTIDPKTGARRGRPRSMPLLDVVDLMLATGVRINEALAVRWEDVDLDARTILISGTLARTDDEQPIIFRQEHRKGHDKSDALLLVLNAHMLDVLTRRMVNADGNPHDLVFPSASGTPIDATNFRKTLRRALEPAGLGWVTPHTFRRTLATEVARKVGVRAAADALGHPDEAVTRRHYVAADTTPVDVVDVVDAFFR